MNNTQIAAYCAGPEIQDCLGLCPNPGIAGIGTRGATFAQAVISGYSMIWLPDPVDRRGTYYVQHLSVLSLVVVGFLYSGVLANRSVTSYHALLIAYLSFGNAANGAVAFYTFIFFHRTIALVAFFTSYVIFGMGVVILAVQATLRPQIGSQAACNAQLVQGPWHAPVAVLFALLGVFPWAFGLLYAIGRRWYTHDHKSIREALRHPIAVLRHKIYWSAVLAVYYSAWIAITERYISAQTLPVLSRSESVFTQAQVQPVSLAIITAFFPMRAIFYGFLYHPNEDHIRSIGDSEQIQLLRRDSI